MKSFVLDSHLLKPGQDFDDLPETYVIFITEDDVLGGNKPIYHIERKIAEMDNDVFGDEEHIIYVNGASEDGETELGRLMHDFKCTEPDEMFFKELAEKSRYFKKTVEGVSSMCKVLEDMRNQTAKDTRASDIEKLMTNLKLTVEQAMDALSVPQSERDVYAELVSRGSVDVV